ncbi:unnamed protein product [Effrenium voratum]|nr:unnamed protein product [Effrenium voratum]
MRLLPASLQNASSCEGWVEKPGYPKLDGCWIHAPQAGQTLPEFHFEEDHEKTRGEPPPFLYLGSGSDCQVRLTSSFPKRLCRLFKYGKRWFLEALLPNQVRLHGEYLTAGQQEALQDRDLIDLPEGAYEIHIEEHESRYLEEPPFPNRFPARWPLRSSLAEAPEAPEELRRLAWQTDQMRRGSEQDQVRVSDWSSFSQYVKQHYLRHGIDCVTWKACRSQALDAKPPSRAPRALAPWLQELLVSERQLPGLQRELPFASCLRASGVEVQTMSPPSLATPVAPAATRAAPTVPSGLAPAVTHEHSVPSAVSTEPAAVAEMPTTDEISTAETPEAPKALQMPIREWLESIDDSLFMLQYYEEIVSHFDSLKQIHDIYVRDSQVDPQFFAAAGVSKLGHKRIIEKWFREHCSPG